MTRLKGSGSLIIGGGSLTLGAGSAERGAGSQTWGAGSKLSYVRKIVNPCVNIRTVWAVVRHKFFVNMAHKKFEWDYLAVLFYDRLDTDVYWPAHVYGSMTWNRLPTALRSPELSLCSFKRQLKTQLSVPALDSAGCSCECRLPSSHRRCCDCTASSAPTTNVPTRLDLTPLDLPFA